MNFIQVCILINFLALFLNLLVTFNWIFMPGLIFITFEAFFGAKSKDSKNV